MNTNDLIDAIQSGDVQNSNNTFNNIMSTKINSALDSHKQDMAGQMFGTVDTENSDNEDV